MNMYSNDLSDKGAMNYAAGCCSCSCSCSCCCSSAATISIESAK
ncbi:listeriolysin S family TOMM bacteriocin [Garciella nitratireducens]|nr:listeriolysin S family TOMM bacteriocin [Garciella nitratireducens]